MSGKVPLNFRDRVDAWGEFARRHAGNPFLELDPLYALPEALIAAIVKEIPRFFTDHEKTFEQDLAALARDHSESDQRQADVDRELRDMLAEEMRDSGAKQLVVERYFQSEAERRREIETRVEAFAGWLVTNPHFREERDGLKKKWREQVEAWGRFPSHRRSFLGEQAWSAGPQPEPVIRGPDWTDERWCEEVTRVNAPLEAFRIFYRRWCLERFLTWDLPQPLWPELSGSTTLDTFTLSEAGVHVFLPWHLLRDHKFTLQDLQAHLKRTRNPTHLDDWLTKGSNKPGLVAYRRRFLLYRYWHLGIAARYPGRIPGNTEALDRAFAAHLNLSDEVKKGAESIKDSRLELTKKLCPPALTHPVSPKRRGK
jgi:hypothetical protein